MAVDAVTLLSDRIAVKVNRGGRDESTEAGPAS
jgi:hypothetical protein